ncbi:hypothetical protein GCM10023162_08430 [Klenkia terrae]
MVGDVVGGAGRPAAALRFHAREASAPSLGPAEQPSRDGQQQPAHAGDDHDVQPDRRRPAAPPQRDLRGDDEDRFELGLGLVLDGLQARLDSRAASRGGPN